MSRNHARRRWGGAPVTKLRRIYAARIQAAYEQGEPLTCPKCSQPITPEQEWDLGHQLALSEGGNPWDQKNIRPEHRGPCNRAAGARLTNEIKQAKRLRKRAWL